MENSILKLKNSDLDKLKDLFVFPFYLSVLLILSINANGQINFTKSWQDTISSSTQDVVLGDVDNDNDLDVLVANRNTGNESTAVFFNDGSGNLNSMQILNEKATGIDFGDIDNDNDLDICLIDANYKIHVWLNDGNGIFTASGIEIQTMSGLEEIYLKDLNADTLPDILVINAEHPDELYFNDGNLTFTKSTQTFGPGTWNGCGSIDITDINKDGYPDIIKGNWGSPSVQLWINDGKGTFTEKIQNFGNHRQHVHAIKSDDLDGDDSPDLFVGYSASDLGGEIWLNDGSGNFTKKQTFKSGKSNFFQDIVLADFDDDGDNDAFIATLGGNNILALNDGTGTFTESEFSIEANGSMAVTAGDLNGDNKADIISTDGTGGFNSIWINQSVAITALINDPVKADHILIYPNPAKHTIQFHHPDLLDIEVIYKILDLSAKTVQSGSTACNTIDVSKINKGTYLLNLNIDGDVILEKFVLR